MKWPGDTQRRTEVRGKKEHNIQVKFCEGVFSMSVWRCWWFTSSKYKQNCWKRKVWKSILVIGIPQIYIIILGCWAAGWRSKKLDKDESVKQVGCLSVVGLISLFSWPDLWLTEAHFEPLLLHGYVGLMLNLSLTEDLKGAQFWRWLRKKSSC